jgi:hypothetical protein
MLYHMHYICVLFIFQQILVYEIIDITLNNVQVSKANNLQTVYIKQTNKQNQTYKLHQVKLIYVFLFNSICLLLAH